MKVLLMSALVVLLMPAGASRPQLTKPPVQSKPAGPIYPKLRADLLIRFKIDQDARNALLAEMRNLRAADLTRLGTGQTDLMKRVETVDKGNVAWMKRVVNKVGWPSKSIC